MNIILGNDHGAVELRKRLVSWLEAEGHTVTTVGPDFEESVDYPDIAKETCALYKRGSFDFGILLCGTGIGISIAANKISGIRCALVHDTFTAALAKQHNDANFIALGGRVQYAEDPEIIVVAYMQAKFEGGRHERRVGKIMNLENSTQAPMSGPEAP